LIVADHYNALAGMLVGYGYDARTAYCGLEALCVAGELNLHALIADTILPDMDVFNLVAEFEERHPDCRVHLTNAAYAHVHMEKRHPFKMVEESALIKEVFRRLDGCRQRRSCPSGEMER
jgi:DNA-binding NtrC family response regulator